MKFRLSDPKKNELQEPSQDMRAPLLPIPGGGWIERYENGRQIRIYFIKSGDHFWYQRIGKMGHHSGQKLTGEKMQRMLQAASEPETSLKIQFPGKIRKVIAQQGQTLKKGESIVIIEAMKMEFALKAPDDLIVLKMLVIEGQQVGPGDQTIEYEWVIKK